MYFTSGSDRAFEQLMQGKPGFDHYDSGEAVTPEDCGTCRFYRPHWKYQFCVYAECPYQPGKLTAYDAVTFRVKGVENMAVFRVERNKGYTVMSNHHLRNKDLSLKAKGLLSQMLSLPENWDYTVTLNDLEDEPPRNPVTKLLLCMFIPFYAIYWFYRSAQRVDRMARGKGIPSELSGTCLLLAFFVPFAPPVLIQEKINTLAQWNGGEMPRLAPQNMSDALRELKQLLDDGVLTQEEFNAKKQQILNL